MPGPSNTITVPAVAGPDGSIGPDLSALPPGVEPAGYTLDPGGATYTVRMPDGWRHPDELAREAAVRAAARLALRPLLDAAEPALAGADLADVAPLFDRWSPGVAYAIGDVASHDEGEGLRPWQAIQAHTSQAGWEPPAVPALWHRYRGADESAPPAGPPAWEASTPYAVGDLVTHGGTTYRCLQAHTSLPGWEPPNVPALWAVA